MTNAKILLVDDHPMLRKGLAQLIALEQNLKVVGEANSGDEAVSLAIAEQPDLILLDLNMKGMSGIDTLTALKRSDFDGKVVIFSVSDNEADVLQALKFGADGYLLKDCEPEQLIEQIQLALQGEVVLSAPLTQIMARALRPQSSKNSALDNLTQRELETLKLIASGKTNKDIANKLGITEATVKVHVKNLLKKLGLKTRVEAAIWVIEQKLTH